MAFKMKNGIQSKNINSKYFIVGLVLFFLSCKKEEINIGSEYYWGNVSANFNNKEWENGKIHGTSNTLNIGFDIIVDVYNEVGFLRESLHIYQIPKIEGVHSILNSIHQDSTNQPGALYNTLQDDGDVLGDVYRLVIGENNFIEISSINGNEVEGAFQVTFAIDDSRDKVFPLAPDTIRFTNGFFHTRLND